MSRREGVAARALERVGAADHAAGGAFEHAEVQGDLHRALETLAPEERELMALRFGADLTLPEIAKALGERRTTVEGRFYRALRKLRGRLE
jgi:RNA polymerase sigma-70 factor (ECF subfamily)